MCSKLVRVFLGTVILFLILGVSPVYAGWREDVGAANTKVDNAKTNIAIAQLHDISDEKPEAKASYEAAMADLEAAFDLLNNLTDYPEEIQALIDNSTFKVYTQIVVLQNAIDCLENKFLAPCLSAEDYIEMLSECDDVILDMSMMLAVHVPASSPIGLFILVGLLVITAGYMWRRQRNIIM